MSTTKDDKLEQLMSRIKESKNSHNKLLNYKKAICRLDELKTEYNNLCDAIKTNKKNPDTDEKVSIEKIISGLNNINEELDNESSDMLVLIDNYVQYKVLLENLETESETFKNEILKVEHNKGKIIINKIDPDDIL